MQFFVFSRTKKLNVFFVQCSVQLFHIMSHKYLTELEIFLSVSLLTSELYEFFLWRMYKAAGCVKVTPDKPWALQGLSSLTLNLCRQGLWCFRHTHTHNTVVHKSYSWCPPDHLLTLILKYVCLCMPWLNVRGVCTQPCHSF